MELHRNPLSPLSPNISLSHVSIMNNKGIEIAVPETDQENSNSLSGKILCKKRKADENPETLARFGVKLSTECFLVHCIEEDNAIKFSIFNCKSCQTSEITQKTQAKDRNSLSQIARNLISKHLLTCPSNEQGSCEVSNIDDKKSSSLFCKTDMDGVIVDQVESREFQASSLEGEVISDFVSSANTNVDEQCEDEFIPHGKILELSEVEQEESQIDQKLRRISLRFHNLQSDNSTRKYGRLSLDLTSFVHPKHKSKESNAKFRDQMNSFANSSISRRETLTHINQNDCLSQEMRRRSYALLQSVPKLRTEILDNYASNGYTDLENQSCINKENDCTIEQALVIGVHENRESNSSTPNTDLSAIKDNEQVESLVCTKTMDANSNNNCVFPVYKGRETCVDDTQSNITASQPIESNSMHAKTNVKHDSLVQLLQPLEGMITMLFIENYLIHFLFFF